jgi:glycosyltransferase involved in cell wall biosynthesis
MSRTLFVHDYMGGWLDRGIPLYTRNLVKSLRKGGWQVRVLTAHGAQRTWPRPLNHLLGALTEQLVSPLVWRLLGARAAIYPYNAMPIVDVFSRRAHIVIHDVMAFEFPAPAYTRLYYRLVYYFVRKTRRPIFTVSPLEIERLRAFGFQDNPIHLIPNSFELFRDLVANQPDARPQRHTSGRGKVLLCTGRAPTKDLPAVWHQLLPAVLRAGWEVEVMGLAGLRADDASWAGSLVVPAGATVLPRLTDEEVVAAYRRSDVVWVHSRQEGFGRCVVEGRLAGRPVVCSDIPEFRQLADASVSTYGEEEDLLAALRLAAQAERPEEYTAYQDFAQIAGAFARMAE